MNLHTTVSRPRTMPDDELDALLTKSGEHQEHWRDHMLISMPFGTGLRIFEEVALNVGDVSHEDGTARRYAVLRTFKGSRRRGGTQEVELPEKTQWKIEAYLMYRRRCGEVLTPDTPLFVSRFGRRLSVRQARRIFTEWQERAGLERHYTFHTSRHNACSSLYEVTKDIRAVQEFARHASIETTQIYTHISRSRLSKAVQRLPC
jgi:site-specific recombinase XerC